MNQLSFDEKAEQIADEARRLSHRDDPVTSRMAAVEFVASGMLSAQRAQVLEALRQWDGSTSCELSKYSGLDRFTCSRRLPELARLGFVKQGERRESKVTGRQAMVWEAVG